jgi:uncharacterized membrane protein
LLTEQPIIICQIVLGEVSKVDKTFERVKDPNTATVNDLDEYRENIRALMHNEIQNALDEELQRASQELREEQRKAIKQILEENKAAIRQIVDEEKKTIWEKAELLRRSILKVGL